jgi:hypothetical protein
VDAGNSIEVNGQKVTGKEKVPIGSDLKIVSPDGRFEVFKVEANWGF